jgi:predicted outer membrane protein
VVSLSPLVAAIVGGAVVLGPMLASAQSDADPDRDYLAAAHQSHLAEIEAGTAAQERGSSPAVRKLGQRLVADHTKLDQDVRRVAQLLDITLPSAPMRRQRAELRRVSGRRGEAFDRAWISQQTTAHRRLLTEGEAETAHGSSPYVQVLAKQADPVLRAHLAMLRETRTGSGSPSAVPAGWGVVAGGISGRAPPNAGSTGAAKPVHRRSASASGGRRAGARLVTRPPVRLQLRAARIDLAVAPIATDRDGTLEIPDDPAVVGWWASGGVPGAPGTVVIAGHVDSRRYGAGAFARLRRVPLHAEVILTTADGGRVRYRVVGRRTYPYDRVPSSVFSRTGRGRLAMITCTSSYDHRHRHYSRALVVYATPKR